MLVDLLPFHLALFLRILPFNCGLFPCFPIICETLLVCLCFLNWSVLNPWVCGLNFYGRRPVRFSSTVSLIWTWCSWDALYATYCVSLNVFWVLIVVGSFFGGSFHPAVWLRVTLPTTSCVVLCRCCQNKTTKHKEKTHICKISPPPPLQSHYQQQMNQY